MRRFPIQTAMTIALIGAVLIGARVVSSAQFRAIFEFAPERMPMTPIAVHKDPEASVLPTPVRPGSPIPKQTLLEDSGGVLDHFYEALWRSEKQEPGAVTRIVHYGDSPTTADLITGDIRAQLQKRYGDAGHGFLLIAKPWAWYQHTGVSMSGSGWQMVPASRFESRDGIFGLGGVSFTGSASASAKVEWQEEQTDFAIWYLQQPGGGTLRISLDGKEVDRLETAGPGKTPQRAAFHAESSARDLSIVVESGTVRLFGITAEKPGPGVVYDSLGLNGASVTVLSRMYNEQHWAAELEQRNPDLVIINYGTNEADFASFVDQQYEKELREALRRVRSALPAASILVMSPMDRGHHTGPGEIETMPTIPRIVETQRRVARGTGCGFFDTFAAMGGEGTMARWYTEQPRLVSADLIHPYPAGGKKIATIFTREVGFGLNRFKLRRVAVP
jgi:lysophospholipase L1-like esterase